jgi:biopolymer transport protein ExbD
MKFRRRHRDRGESHTIDVTPMMDAAFILIIFLLISTAFKKKDHAFDIQLPKATEKEVIMRSDGLSVFLTSAGKVFMMDEGSADRKEVSPEELSIQLEGSVQEDPDVPVNLVIDEGTAYTHIVRVIDALKKVGVSNLQLPYEANNEAAPKN